MSGGISDNRIDPSSSAGIPVDHPAQDLPEDVGYFELVERPAEDQPWRVRVVDSGNHEKVFWTEDYLEEPAALDAIRWLGRLFSPISDAFVQRGPGDLPEPGPAGSWLHMAIRRVGGGSEYLSIPIHHLRVDPA